MRLHVFLLTVLASSRMAADSIGHASAFSNWTRLGLMLRQRNLTKVPGDMSLKHGWWSSAVANSATRHRVQRKRRQLSCCTQGRRLFGAPAACTPCSAPPPTLPPPLSPPFPPPPPLPPPPIPPFPPPPPSPPPPNICTFIPGDGNGASELFIGTAASAQACASSVVNTQPTANGATFGNAGAQPNAEGSCFAEFGMTGSWGPSATYITCLLPTG